MPRVTAKQKEAKLPNKLMGGVGEQRELTESPHARAAGMWKVGGKRGKGRGWRPSSTSEKGKGNEIDRGGNAT